MGEVPALEHYTTCPIHIGFFGFEEDGRAPQICPCGILHTYDEYEEAIKNGKKAVKDNGKG